MVKLIGTAYKRDDFTTEEFFRYWREIHAPITAKAPGIRGYVVSEVLRKYEGGELEADAFVELWWDDEEALEHAITSRRSRQPGPTSPTTQSSTARSGSRRSTCTFRSPSRARARSATRCGSPKVGAVRLSSICRGRISSGP